MIFPLKMVGCMEILLINDIGKNPYHAILFIAEN
jgi:hypothetical protein